MPYRARMGYLAWRGHTLAPTAYNSSRVLVYAWDLNEVQRRTMRAGAGDGAELASRLPRARVFLKTYYVSRSSVGSQWLKWGKRCMSEELLILNEKPSRPVHDSRVEAPVVRRRRDFQRPAPVPHRQDGGEENRSHGKKGLHDVLSVPDSRDPRRLQARCLLQGRTPLPEISIGTTTSSMPATA